MVLINKEEACCLREIYPNAHIVRTMKNKSKRHKYYCEETRDVMAWLRNKRCCPNEHGGRSGGRHV